MKNDLNIGMSAASTMASKSKSGSSDESWFKAMSEAWGKALDDQAAIIVARSEQLDLGNDSPSDVAMLTADSLKMSFLSNSSHTAMTSVGTSLETLARKQ